MNIPVQVIKFATGCDDAHANEWKPALDAAARKYEINTPRRVCAWLANVGVECAGFTRLVEGLNYSAQGLANTWERYSSTGKRGGPPNALALSLARKPEAIANSVYANRGGNGPESSGHGWKYRGHGPIQLTFLETYLAFQKSSEIEVVANPELLTEPEAGAMSAAWFWTAFKKCNGAADAGNFDETVRRVNGALPRDSNHGELRRQRYQASLWAYYSIAP